MTAPWIAAFVALSVLVLFLGFLVLGLLRRTLVMLSRIELVITPDKSEVQDAPPVGAHLPSLQTTNGSAGKVLAGGSDWSMVVFMDVDCEPCQVLADDLGRRRAWPGSLNRVLVVDDAALIASKTSPWDVYVDPTGTTRRAWSVTATPTAVLIDEDGHVRATSHPNKAADLIKLQQHVPAPVG